ncbi:MAG: hypothetical protein JRG91_05865 [Deltaproteobacteria bacterium]|nr:hypothetical protein [Deltaproteobacteria bacterium]
MDGKDSWTRWLPSRRTSLLVLEHLIVFSCALALIHRASGQSPVLLYDTSLEEAFVQSCRQLGLCPLFGSPTNLSGFWQGGAWIYLRTFLDWLGLGPQGVHVLVQALDAAAITLIALCGSMLRGRSTGWAAALVAAGILLSSDIMIGGLHNSRFIFFPASLCTTLLVASSRTRSVLPLVLAAVTAAVVSNVHAACLPLVLSVALVASLRSRRRVLAAAAWGAGTLSVMFLLSPGMWSHQLASLFRPGGVLLQPSLGSMSGPGVFEIAAVLAAAVLVVAWTRGPVSGSRLPLLKTLLAVLLPGLVIYASAEMLVQVTRAERYSVYLVPAFSLALVAACAWLLERIAPLAGRIRTTGWMRQAISFLALAAALAWIVFHAQPKSGHDLRFRDMWEIKQYLHALGWSLEDQYRHVKSPRQHALVSSLMVYSPFESSGPDVGDEGRNVYVFKAAESRMPAALPDHWTASPRAEGMVMVTVLSPTWMDWSSFQVCREQEGGTHCRDSGLHLARRGYMDVMGPMPGLRGEGRARGASVQVRFSVRIPPGAREHVILFPEILYACRGRVASVPAGSTIADGGRQAHLVTGSDPVDGTLVLEWRPGSTDCPEYTFQGMVPFFIEAEPETAALMQSLLEGGL